MSFKPARAERPATWPILFTSIPLIGFRILVSVTWIPDSQRSRDSGSLSIPKAKNSRIQESRLLDMGWNMKFNVSPRPSGGGWGGGGGWGTLLYIDMYRPRVFATLWSENEYRLCSFWSGIGCGFQGNYVSVRRYLSFQFQTCKKEREICEFEMDFKKSFLLLL